MFAFFLIASFRDRVLFGVSVCLRLDLINGAYST